MLPLPLKIFHLPPPAHSVRRRPSKTVPRQTQAKFLFRDDQSYSLTINLKNFSLLSIVKCPKSWPENRAYFIKAAHRRNHSRVKLATRKMFAMMHLRKKKFSNFPDSGSGIRIRTICFPDFLKFSNLYLIWFIRSQIVY